MLKTRLLNLSRSQKRLIQISADLVLICFSVALAFISRLGWDRALELMAQHLWLFFTAPLISILVFFPAGMYRPVIRFLGVQAIASIFRAITLAAFLVLLAIYWQGEQSFSSIPRSYIVIYWFYTLLTLGGVRLFMRQYFRGELHLLAELFLGHLNKNASLPKVAIYGAGNAGNQLLIALRMSNDLVPVAFVDDHPDLIGRQIAGLHVYAADDIQQMLNKTKASQILLAMPSATQARRKQIIRNLAPYPLYVRTIPGLIDLAQGKVTVNDLREIEITDLLGRDVVEPHRDLFDRCIKQQVVMVTGAGGSIGSELCRQILHSRASVLVLYEHSEFNLYQVHQELKQLVNLHGLDIQLVPILASIRNFKRLREVMTAYKVNTVYHAAAYKHVPMVEENMVEGVMNNVFGTLNSAQAAMSAGVENFILISTDKAVRPTNVMGATKRLAELILQAFSKESFIADFAKRELASYENKTRFTMVRFGNVLGSSGSVIPLFRQQIKKGGPVTVTHPEITRYFMTIPEAVQLVIQAGSMGKGGDVFVLDMGEPVKIASLAEKMVRLMGLTVQDEQGRGDIAIEFSGLRPGEKLYEELLVGESSTPTEHEKILSAEEVMIAWPQLEPQLRKLKEAAEAQNCFLIRDLLIELVEGYQPQCELVDWLCLQKSKAKKLN